LFDLDVHIAAIAIPAMMILLLLAYAILRLCARVNRTSIGNDESDMSSTASAGIALDRLHSLNESGRNVRRAATASVVRSSPGASAVVLRRDASRIGHDQTLRQSLETRMND